MQGEHLVDYENNEYRVSLKWITTNQGLKLIAAANHCRSAIRLAACFILVSRKVSKPF